MAALATIPNDPRTDAPLRAHSISEEELSAIVRCGRISPSVRPVALQPEPFPAAPVKFPRAVPANSVEHIQQVAARDLAERPAVTAAPTGRRSVQEMSNKQIVSEVYNLHDAFQELSARYEKAGGREERSALRDQMRPVVQCESELREGYLGRITQEIRRDAVEPRVGESRRVMGPRMEVAGIAAAR
jgi:hypothetical protein